MTARLHLVGRVVYVKPARRYAVILYLLDDGVRAMVMFSDNRFVAYPLDDLVRCENEQEN